MQIQTVCEDAEFRSQPVGGKALCVTETTAYGQQLYSYCEVKWCGCLPFHIRHLPSIKSFKHIIKIHLFYQHYFLSLLMTSLPPPLPLQMNVAHSVVTALFATQFFVFYVCPLVLSTVVHPKYPVDVFVSCVLP